MSELDTVPIRELRNDVAKVIRRVEAGESIDVTRNGVRVAQITPIRDRGRWKSVDEFRASAHLSPTDPELLALIQDLRRGEFADPYERWERR
jgi:prevent-host-death family protein